MKKKRKVAPKKRLSLPEDLEKRLAVYALAAGAAGAGLAATAQRAQANIYTYTPNPALTVTSNGNFHFSGTFVSSQGQPLLPPTVFLDLFRGQVPGMCSACILASESGSQYRILVSPTADVLKLDAGASIGPNGGSFLTYGILEGRTNGGSFIGDWTGTGVGYIGLDLFGFFGWVKVSNSVTAGGINAKILEAAIDGTRNQVIKAGQTSDSLSGTPVPEPGTLPLLALGAAGLLALRKKRLAEPEREPAAKG